MKTLRSHIISFLTQDGIMAILSMSVLFLNAVGLLTHNVWLIRIFLVTLLSFGAFLFATGFVLLLTLVIPDRLLDAAPLATLRKKLSSHNRAHVESIKPLPRL